MFHLITNDSTFTAYSLSLNTFSEYLIGIEWSVNYTTVPIRHFLLPVKVTAHPCITAETREITTRTSVIA
jgi:hypothetical protein